MPTPRPPSWTRRRSGSSSASSPRTTSRRALDALKKWKENVRLLQTGELVGGPQGLDYRRVDGGLLVQTRDVGADDPDKWKVVTKRQPTEDELHGPAGSPGSSASTSRATRSCWRTGTQVVGVGAGQMSRVDSVADRGAQGRRRVEGRGAGVGRVLPVPRQRRRGGRGRRDGDRPAGRVACATPTRSRPATSTASRCCSPASGTSGIDPTFRTGFRRAPRPDDRCRPRC